MHDAPATFALTLPAPRHSHTSTAQESVPETSPVLSELPRSWEKSLRRLGGYSLHAKRSIEFRVPEIDSQVNPEHARNRLRFWLKAKHQLPPEGACTHRPLPTCRTGG